MRIYAANAIKPRSGAVWLRKRIFEGADRSILAGRSANLGPWPSARSVEIRSNRHSTLHLAPNRTKIARTRMARMRHWISSTYVRRKSARSDLRRPFCVWHVDVVFDLRRIALSQQGNLSMCSSIHEFARIADHIRQMVTVPAFQGDSLNVEVALRCFRQAKARLIRSGFKRLN